MTLVALARVFLALFSYYRVAAGHPSGRNYDGMMELNASETLLFLVAEIAEIEIANSA